MAESPSPVTVKILDKDYNVVCPEEEREALVEAASFLDGRMREVRDTGKVLGSERIAVITALNIAHELLVACRDREDIAQTLENGVQRMAEKIEVALKGDNAG